MEEKEIYAKRLAKRAENCFFAIKILFFISLVTAFALVVFVITAFTAIGNAETKIIGFAAFIALTAALLTGAGVCFAVAKVSLYKLKKLG